jgi:hypothetical protein
MILNLKLDIDLTPAIVVLSPRAFPANGAQEIEICHDAIAHHDIS